MPMDNDVVMLGAEKANGKSNGKIARGRKYILFIEKGYAGNDVYPFEIIAKAMGTSSPTEIAARLVALCNLAPGKTGQMPNGARFNRVA